MPHMLEFWNERTKPHILHASTSYHVLYSRQCASFGLSFWNGFAATSHPFDSKEIEIHGLKTHFGKRLPKELQKGTENWPCLVLHIAALPSFCHEQQPNQKTQTNLIHSNHPTLHFSCPRPVADKTIAQPTFTFFQLHPCLLGIDHWLS